MDSQANSIGERVFRFRTGHGMTQRELGKRANLSRIAISLIESGKTKPQIGSLRKLAQALEVVVGDLTGEGGPHTPIVVRYEGGALLEFKSLAEYRQIATRLQEHVERLEDGHYDHHENVALLSETNSFVVATGYMLASPQSLAEQEVEDVLGASPQSLAVQEVEDLHRLYGGLLDRWKAALDRLRGQLGEAPANVEETRAALKAPLEPIAS